MTGATMPATTSPPSPPPSRLICATKQMDITPTSAPMNASSLRTPKLCSPRNSSVESDVTPTPQAVGKPKISFSASAVPITSGMSLATMASSVATHSAFRTRGGYSSRITRARCHPVASAKRTHMACTNRPAIVAQSNTQSREKPYCTPACRSDSKFPGSTYPMHMRKPGPRNARNLRTLNVSVSSSMPAMCTLRASPFELPVGPTNASSSPRDVLRAAVPRTPPSLRSASAAKSPSAISRSVIVAPTPDDTPEPRAARARALETGSAERSRTRRDTDATEVRATSCDEASEARVRADKKTFDCFSWHISRLVARACFSEKLDR